jgi:hypothetical protein
MFLVIRKNFMVASCFYFQNLCWQRQAFIYGCSVLNRCFCITLHSKGVYWTRFKVDWCFRSALPPLSLLRWWRQFAPLKYPSTSLRLHGTISQKAVIFRYIGCLEHIQCQAFKWQIKLLGPALPPLMPPLFSLNNMPPLFKISLDMGV